MWYNTSYLNSLFVMIGATKRKEMNQLFKITLLLLILNTSTYAQQADGTTAPDFTLVDIDGNTWNLQSLLNDGKTVILEISIIRCAPCWDSHQSGAPYHIYDDFGPSGVLADNAVVLFIETDGGTGMDELNWEENIECSTRFAPSFKFKNKGTSSLGNCIISYQLSDGPFISFFSMTGQLLKSLSSINIASLFGGIPI